MSDVLRAELAGAAAQGGTIIYQDETQAVIEYRQRTGVIAGMVGTFASLFLAVLIGAAVGAASPEVGLIVVVVLAIAGLVFTWRTSVRRFRVWVDEAGAVQVHKA
jgi:hypothetical protein